MIKKIVWVSFGPDVSDEALNYAIYFAKIFDSKIYSLYIKPTTYFPEKEHSLSEYERKKNIEWNNHTFRQNLNKIEKLQIKINKEKIDNSYTILEGVPCLEILNFAKVKSADLIVMDKGKNLFNESTVQKTTLYIINHSKIPVLTVNPSENINEIKTILVPTNKYNICSKAFNLACNISKKLNTHIVQLNILKKNDPTIPTEEVERMHGDVYFNLSKSEIENKNIESAVIDSENISKGIIEYTSSNEIDLIILQTYCGEKQEIFHSNGSITDKVIQQVKCPVITINSKEEVELNEE
ncbi:MAG: universal stress protein [Thermodesulfobacteriota bacterium]